MLPDPFVTFRPEIPFFHVKSLLGQLGSPRRHFFLRSAKRTENPTDHPQIEQHEDRSNNYPREHALAGIDELVPRLHHFALPSNRNRAWPVRKMRGTAMSNL